MRFYVHIDEHDIHAQRAGRGGFTGTLFYVAEFTEEQGKVPEPRTLTADELAQFLPALEQFVLARPELEPEQPDA